MYYVLLTGDREPSKENKTGFVDDRKGKWIAGFEGSYRDHNRQGYEIRVARKDRKKWQQIRRNDLRDHLHQKKRNHEETTEVDGSRKNRLQARVEDRGKAYRTSASQGERRLDRKHASKGNEEPSRRRDSSRMEEDRSRNHRDRSPLEKGKRNEPSRGESSRSEKRHQSRSHRERSPLDRERYDSNGDDRRDDASDKSERRALLELEERVSKLRLEEDQTRQEQFRKEVEEEENRRRKFREEMELWNAKHELDKSEMEEWRKEKEFFRRARDEDSMEQFKQAMSEILQPLLSTTLKKKKNVK